MPKGLQVESRKLLKVGNFWTWNCWNACDNVLEHLFVSFYFLCGIPAIVQMPKQKSQSNYFNPKWHNIDVLFSLDCWEFLKISKQLRTVIYKHTACSLGNSLNETKYNGQASKKNIFYSLTNQQRMFASKVSTPLIGASKNTFHKKMLLKDYKIILENDFVYTFERQMSRDIGDVFFQGKKDLHFVREFNLWNQK